VNAPLRTPREEALRQSVSRMSVLLAGTPLSTARDWATGAAAGAGTPTTLRERALAGALHWIAAAPDGTRIAEVRAYASAALLALDAPENRLRYWTEYTERRIANGTAARALA
jgi:hypothetical protein